jgi:hypothetical protein
MLPGLAADAREESRMIERYTRPEMGRIWDLENKFEIWKEIEVLACEAQVELGVMPAEDVAVIRERAAFEVERIEPSISTPDSAPTTPSPAAGCTTA